MKKSQNNKAFMIYFKVIKINKKLISRFSQGSQDIFIESSSNMYQSIEILNN